MKCSKALILTLKHKIRACLNLRFCKKSIGESFLAGQKLIIFVDLLSTKAKVMKRAVCLFVKLVRLKSVKGWSCAGQLWSILYLLYNKMLQWCKSSYFFGRPHFLYHILRNTMPIRIPWPTLKPNTIILRRSFLLETK